MVLFGLFVELCFGVQNSLLLCVSFMFYNIMTPVLIHSSVTSRREPWPLDVAKNTFFESENQSCMPMRCFVLLLSLP